MAKDRTLKVGDCCWRTESNYPGLRLGGKWLEKCGFDYGDSVRVVCDKDNLKIVKMQLPGDEPEGGTMTNKATIKLVREKDCKHSIRYLYQGSEPSPLVKTVYLDRVALGNPIPDEVVITIEPAK